MLARIGDSLDYAHSPAALVEISNADALHRIDDEVVSLDKRTTTMDLWTRRLEQRRRGIVTEADSLIAVLGVDAYAEARRRRSEANSFSAAHYWFQVKTEIGRRIAAECGDADSFDSLEARLSQLGPRADAVSRSAWKDRFEAEALVRTIEEAPAGSADKTVRADNGRRTAFCDVFEAGERPVVVGVDNRSFAEGNGRFKPQHDRERRALPAAGRLPTAPEIGEARRQRWGSRDHRMEEMRASMKKGDLDGVLKALRELRRLSEVFALN